MTAFLFWNLNKKPLQENIANIVFHYETDVIILAESSIPPETMLKTLNRDAAWITQTKIFRSFTYSFSPSSLITHEEMNHERFMARNITG